MKSDVPGSKPDFICLTKLDDFKLFNSWDPPFISTRKVVLIGNAMRIKRISVHNKDKCFNKVHDSHRYPTSRNHYFSMSSPATCYIYFLLQMSAVFHTSLSEAPGQSQYFSGSFQDSFQIPSKILLI